MLSDPVGAFDWSYTAMHSIPREELDQIQLKGLQARFGRLRDSVPMLTKLADEQKADGIDDLNDVVPLLFSHTIYKSYPISLLEKGRFDLMTQWLNKLTMYDLSHLQMRDCGSIDDWIARLDEQTPLNLRHSSGTTGTVSFIPRTRAEAEKHFWSAQFGMFTTLGYTPPKPDKPLSMDVIHASYRYGSTTYLRSPDNLIKHICGGDEAQFHALYPGKQSADVMFLAGRLRAAQAKGQLDRLELTPAMLRRKSELEAMQNSADDLKQFYATVSEKLRGKRIYTQGPWSNLFNVASAGLEMGMKEVFAPDSILITVGGPKGQKLPDDWQEQVKRFFGTESFLHMYGMSEVMANNKLCSANRYHIEPWSILFVLDPDTGKTLPREGVQTGRAAFYDLQAETYWGGFVSGDEVTVDWNYCSCGQLSPHISPSIVRYSDKKGGDDKISCAAAADAHESALQYLKNIEM